MHVTAPLSLVVASCRDRDTAAQDLHAVWSARNDGDFHHTSVAALSRDADGAFEVGLSDTTAKHLLWGGGLMGGALFLLAPAAGAAMLTATGLTGAGAIVGHIRLTADPEALDDAVRLLDASTAAVVVVTVNRPGVEVTALLEQATAASVVDMVWGDLEEELCQDFADPRSERVRYAS